MSANSILIASPVNKNIKILEEFLHSLEQLETDGCDIFYCFADDNDDKPSSDILGHFVRQHPRSELLEIEDMHKNSDWEKADHTWTSQKTDKIACIKNNIIKYFLDKNFSHLFFVDADLVLHPKTLLTLLNSDKDIIANIFWTKWQEESQPLPQVWLKDFYTLYDAHMLTPKTPEQIQTETLRFISQLCVPGIYKVGGLGACTLIRRKVLESGVNFSPIYNLSFWGEDRSFCIRAAALGFELYVNTVYPAFHIYRMDDLEKLPEWRRKQH